MKKVFIIIGILLVIFAIFIALRKRQLEQEGRPATRFRDFFTFNTNKTLDPDGSDGVNDGDFTDPTDDPTAPGGSDSVTPDGIPIKSAFTDTPPVTPPGTQGSNTPPPGTGTSTGGGQTGGNGGGSTPPILPPDEDDDTPPAPLCSIDDLEIEFTAGEIAELRELEEEFYLLAPTLRSDQDVLAERGNWSNYTLLNGTFIDMNNYCVEATPKLSSNIKHYRRTPFWNDSQSKDSFIGRTDGGLDINLNQPSDKRLGYIERFFRLNIW